MLVTGCAVGFRVPRVGRGRAGLHVWYPFGSTPQCVAGEHLHYWQLRSHVQICCIYNSMRVACGQRRPQARAVHMDDAQNTPTNGHDKDGRRGPYNLVIALAGPYGSGCSAFGEELAKVLSDWEGVVLHRVKVSDILAGCLRLDQYPRGAERKSLLQQFGTFLRSRHAELVAELIIQEISTHAYELQKDESAFANAKTVVHLVDSLKNVHDVAALRRLYGFEFYFVYITTDKDTRWKRLKAYRGWDASRQSEFETLDARDSNENSLGDVGDAGQQVRDLAGKADYYLVNDQSRKELREKAERFFELLMVGGLGQPSAHETAMHAAYSEAARSFCLSRRVGAALLDANGSLLSLGHNDVPKNGGGLYAYMPPSDHETTGKPRDYRCYIIGDRKCANHVQKGKRFDALAGELRDKLLKNYPKVLPEATNTASEALRSQLRKVVEDSAFRDATEYCRAVHAEMEALMACLRAGRGSPVGGTMYVTTQPCHNCVKHIICAGIAKVYFIEPYPKSLSEVLHGNESSLDSGDEPIRKLPIIQYEGVAPWRYVDFFPVVPVAGKWKDKNGTFVEPTKGARAGTPLLADRLRKRYRSDGPGADSTSVLEAYTVRETSDKLEKALDLWKVSRRSDNGNHSGTTTGEQVGALNQSLQGG